MNAPIYKMKLDLNVLNHLGLNLYSNVAAVLSEAVANSWDADATEVRVNIAGNSDMIEISDNGCGMTIGDANDRFLNVGYSKRKVKPARLAVERWPGMPWNTGPTSRGIMARHAVESAKSAGPRIHDGKHRIGGPAHVYLRGS